jgi:glycosyltransferase involved in cell wall biosynthesis
MKILFITFVYNEKAYLPDIISYYQKQGIDIYIIDNMSVDGTFEWLLENNIPCSRLDTNESFDLRLLQAEADRIIEIKKPEWVVYGGADLYYIFNKTIREVIEDVDKSGFNQVSCNCYGALNTGEPLTLPLYKCYQYGVVYRPLIMISKYVKGFKLEGDSIKVDEPNVFISDGIMVNYGACKPLNEQKIKLQRRQKAWVNGLDPRTGKHFLKYKEINWLWKRKPGMDLLECPDKELFKKLIYES